MSNSFDKLDKLLSTESSIVEIDSDSTEIEVVNNENGDIKKDYDYTRANLYSLIEKGQEAINGILELAGEGGSPRAYEVAGQLIKNVADATDKLMELQKKLRDIEEEPKKSPTTVNNSLFVGSTAELAKLLKQQSQDITNQ